MTRLPTHGWIRDPARDRIVHWCGWSAPMSAYLEDAKSHELWQLDAGKVPSLHHECDADSATAHDRGYRLGYRLGYEHCLREHGWPPEKAREHAKAVSPIAIICPGCRRAIPGMGRPSDATVHACVEGDIVLMRDRDTDELTVVFGPSAVALVRGALGLEPVRVEPQDVATAEIDPDWLARQERQHGKEWREGRWRENGGN